MSKRFKKFLKHFNISMVVVLFISSLGVLPSALTAEQVQAAEKILNNGQYQQKVGSAEVYNYGQDTNPRQQYKTTVDYSREGSPREIPVPEPVGWFKTLKKKAKSVVKKITKPIRSVKKWVAPKPKPRPRPKPAPRRWTPPRITKRVAQKVKRAAPKWKAPKRKAPQKKKAPKRHAPKKKQNNKKKAPKKQNKKKAKPKKQNKKKRPSLMKKAKQKAKNFKKNVKNKVKKGSKNLKKAAKSVKKAAKNVKKGATKAFNNSKNWAKKNKGKFLKAGDIVGDFIGLKDGYAVITGKDWSTGKKVSRGKAAAWLVVGFTPMGKAAKGAKIAAKGAKAARAAKKANSTKKKTSLLKKSANAAKKAKQKFKPKKKSPNKKPPKKKNTALQAGNRAQRRAANKKGHSGSKKNKDKLNKQRQKKNKAASQQRKKTKNAKSKKRNSPLKKSHSKAKDLKKKQSKPQNKKKAPHSLDVEAKKYWNKRVEFKGQKVYQRNDLIDPNKINTINGKQITNRELMAKGNAPFGPDGKRIELHHMTQRNESAIAEVSSNFHRTNKTTLHINPTSTPSGINRTEFKAYRESYWKNRLNDFK